MTGLAYFHRGNAVIVARSIGGGGEVVWGGASVFRGRNESMSAGAGAVVLVGRILFAVFFARSAWGHYRRQPMMIGYARSAKLPLPYLAGWPSALWLGAGSILLALGIWPDLGALMLGAFVIPAALYFHRFWTIEDPGQRQTQAGSFFRNVALLGASLAIFGLLATIGSGLRFSITAPLFKF